MVDKIKKTTSEDHPGGRDDYLNDIVEALTHPFYIIDVEDFSVKLANTAARLGGLSEKSFCYVLTHQRNSPCGQDSNHPCPLQIVKETKQPIRVQHIHYDITGLPRIVDIHGYPIKNNDGEVVQMIEYCLDVTDLHKSERALQERNQILEAISFSAQQLLNIGRWDNNINEVLGRVGEATGVSRIYIFQNNREEAKYSLGRQCYEWVSSSVIPQAASADRDCRTIPEEIYHKWTETLAGGELIISPSKQSTQIEIDILRKWDIYALLIVPIFVEESWWGYIQLELCRSEQQWTQVEIDAIRTIAKNIGAAIHLNQIEGILSDSNANLTATLEETRRRTKELAIITRVTESMRVAKSRSQIPPIVLKELLALFSADGAALLIHNQTNGKTYIELAVGVLEDCSGAILPFSTNGNSLSDEISLPYPVKKISASILELFPGMPVALISMVGAPLIIDNVLLGSLWIGKEDDLTEAEQRLLNTIADMVANALHRSELHEHLKTQLDIQKTTQARLVQSEKLAAIGELVAGVAHELNNPLTSVVLYTQTLQSQVTDESIKNDLEKVSQEAKRACKIIHGLLGFARQRPSQRESVNVNNILSSTLELLDHEFYINNISVTIKLAQNLPLTLADPYQLQQVFVNILTNAFQSIQAENSRQKTIVISTQAAVSQPADRQDQPIQVIRVMFQDNGPGIPDSDLPKIFDPFFTTKEPGQGTGLGLAVCHGIIGEHGGSIWAESNLGHGTIFIIELPIVKPEALAEISYPDTIVSPPTSSSQAKRILLIDDEISVLTIMKRALEKEGFLVEAVTRAQSGLELLNTNHYDLIICDIRMPEMDGTEFFKAIEHRLTNISKRIIFTTGDLVSASTRDFLAKSNAQCLVKPFDLHEMLEKVQSVTTISRL